MWGLYPAATEMSSSVAPRSMTCSHGRRSALAPPRAYAISLFPDCPLILLGRGMDAAKPLGRWLFALGLAAAIGCKSYEKLPFPTIRGQAPAGEPVAPVPPPGPLSPLSPSGTSLPVGRVVPAAPTGPGSVVQ